MEEKKVCCMEWKNHKCAHIAVSILVILIAIFLVKGIFNCGGRENKNTDQNTIVVSGKGELAVKPDIATVSFSVMEENKDVSYASDAVNTKIAKIMSTLKVDGVDEKDIKTTDYSIYPRYNYVNAQMYPYNGTQVLAGYDVTQSIEVKIKDLSKAGKIITDLGTLNVTNMSGLNFTEDKYDDLVRQARDEAIADARSQAQSLAKSLGVKLGKIVSYSEGSTPIYYGMGVSNAAPMMTKSEAVLPTGENKITSNVSVTYEIK